MGEFDPFELPLEELLDHDRLATERRGGLADHEDADRRRRSGHGAKSTRHAMPDPGPVALR